LLEPLLELLLELEAIAGHDQAAQSIGQVVAVSPAVALQYPSPQKTLQCPASQFNPL